jgi:hypothetical protein
MRWRVTWSGAHSQIKEHGAFRFFNIFSGSGAADRNPALFRDVRRLQVSVTNVPFSPTDVMHRVEGPFPINEWRCTRFA